MFECLVDGQYDTHMDNQSYVDGRLVSWATEAEFYAVSALYELNVKITETQSNEIKWLTHIFRDGNILGGRDMKPYSRSLCLLLKNSHFSIIKQLGDDKKRRQVEEGNKCPPKPSGTIDWF